VSRDRATFAILVLNEAVQLAAHDDGDGIVGRMLLFEVLLRLGRVADCCAAIADAECLREAVSAERVVLDVVGEEMSPGDV
jgi:hypothetical protein